MSNNDDEVSDIAQMSAAIASNLASARSHSIPYFFGKKEEDVLRFLRIYNRVAGALKWNDRDKFDKFSNYLRDAAEEWYYVNVECAEINDEPSDWDDLEIKFKDRFLRGDYKAYLVRELRMRKQKKDESLLSYITSIRALCYDLNKKMGQEEIIEWIYNGMQEDAAECIMANSDPQTVDDMIRAAKKVERANESIKNRKVKSVNSVAVDETESLSKMIEKLTLALNKNTNKVSNDYKANDKGKAKVNTANKIPENTKKPNIECFFCKNKGHYKKDCFKYKSWLNKRDKSNKVQSSVNLIKESDSEKESDCSVNNITVNLSNLKDRNLFYIQVKINNKVFTALVDSGAEVTLMNKKIAKELKLKVKEYSGPRVTAVTGDSLRMLGQCKVKVELKAKDKMHKANIEMLVVEQLPIKADILMGNNCSALLGINLDFNTNKIYIKGNEVINVSAIQKTTLNSDKGNANSDKDIRTKCKHSNEITNQSSNNEIENLKWKTRGCFVHSNENKTLNGKSITVVEVNLTNNNRSKQGLKFLYTSDELYNSNKLLISNGIIDATKQNAIVFVANLKPNNIQITEGHILGSFEYIENNVHDIDLITNECHSNCPNESSEKFCSLSCTSSEKSTEINDGIDVKIIDMLKGKIIVGASLSENEIKTIKVLIEKYANIFSFDSTNIGTIKNYYHSIQTGNSLPISTVPNKCSFEEMKIIDDEITKLEKAKIIRPSFSPWSSRTVLVQKKDGSPRLCIDYRPLNKVTIRDTYALPNTDICIKALAGNKYFTSLDMASAFHQIPIKESDIQKTAFISPSGKFYEYVKLPYGMSNSSSSYQRAIDITLSGLKYSHLVCFIDDILVFARNFQEHQQRLEVVFKRLSDAGFTLKASKCNFAMNSVVFLGIKVSESGIQPSARLLNSIKNYPIPKDVTAIKSFLGLSGFFRKFIAKFSQISEPLTMLTRKNNEFYWSEAQQKAFELLKEKLISKPILAFFHTELPTELHTDASLTGLAGSLLQRHEKGLKVVGYFSRLLRGSEKNYAIYDLEILAIVESMKFFRDMISGIKFKLLTDNLAASYVMNKKDLTGRLARAQMAMICYDFEIIHKKSEQNKIADCLSRYPVNWPLVKDSKQVSILSLNEILSLNKIRYEQSKDEFCKTVMLKLKERQINKRLNNFIIKDDILYKKIYINSDNNINSKLQTEIIVIPKSLRMKVLYDNHDSLFGAHLGRNKTSARIKSKFWFPKMTKFINNYIKSCLKCQRKKVLRMKPAGKLIPIIYSEPFEMVGIDFYSPGIKAKGYEYIIVLTCGFSKYAIAKPLRKADAKSTAKFLFYDVICTYGTPKKLLSDRAQTFMGNTIKELTKLMNIKQLYTSGYRPQTNGLTEKFNDLLGNCIAMFVNDDQTNWPDLIQPIVHAYNTSLHPTIKITPFEVIFGRKAILPFDIELNQEVNTQQLEPRTYSQTLKQYLDTIKRKVEIYIKEHTNVKSKYYNRKRRENHFKVGDKVWLYEPALIQGKSNKLISRYDGPHVIMEQTSPNTYKLNFPPKTNRSNIVNVQRLKRYDRKELLTNDEDDIRMNKSKSNHLDNRSESEQIKSKVFVKEKSINKNSKQKICKKKKENKPEIILSDSYSSISSNSSSTSPMQSSSSSEESQSEMPDETPILRRSTRTRGRIDRWGYTSFICLSLLCLVFGINGLATMDPLIWHKELQPVIDGVESVTTVINYESPCKLFTDILIDEVATNELKQWCEDEYKNSFITPLNSFCKAVGPKNSTKFGLTKTKRSIILGAIAVVTLISVVASIGVATASLVETNKVQKLTDSLELEAEKAMDSIKTLKMNSHFEKEILKNFKLLIENLTNEVYNVIKTVDLIKETAPKAMRLVAHLTTRFHHIKLILQDTARNIKQNKYDNKLLDIFNVTMPCGINCPIEYWTPISCVYDELREIIIIKHQMKLVNKRYHIMKAHPFDLVKIVKKDKSLILCHSNYVGPKTIIFDEISECIIPIKITNLESSNLILAPNEVSCSNNSNKAGMKYWRKGICEIREQIDDNDILQIKQSASYNYVYCSSLNITVYNREIPCPDEVFPLPSNISFKVGSFNYKAQQAIVHSELHFVPTWTYRVNHHLDPLMRQNIYESYIKQIDESLSHMVDESNIDSINLLNDQNTNIILILLIIILSGVLLSMVYVIKKSLHPKVKSMKMWFRLKKSQRRKQS